jgi:hypothetical protein
MSHTESRNAVFFDDTELQSDYHHELNSLAEKRLVIQAQIVNCETLIRRGGKLYILIKPLARIRFQNQKRLAQSILSII